MAECKDTIVAANSTENLVNLISTNSINTTFTEVMIPEDLEKIPQWKEEFLRRKQGFKNCCSEG